MRQTTLFSMFLVGLTAAIAVNMPQVALAGTSVNDIAYNMGGSATKMPGLVSAISYILGLLFAGLGVLKMKEHVDNPNQTPLRDPMTRLFVGGGLFALPTIYQAMRSLIQRNDVNFTAIGAKTDATGDAGFNDILQYIGESFTTTPGLISAVAYLLGLVLGVAGILKIKDHVDNPAQVPLREPVIRLAIGGGLFALPALYAAMQSMIAGGGGDGVLNFFNPSAGGGSQGNCGEAGDGGLGGVICNVRNRTDLLPVFFSAASYMFGLILGIWGLFKLKDHVLNPQHHPVWEPLSRFTAAGAFFALPYVVGVMARTLGGPMMEAWGISGHKEAVEGGGLDSLMTQFMADIYSPMLYIITAFSYIAGIVLIMIGISRLLKSAQDGARGPGGLGTLMTFLTGGALLSMAPMIGRASVSLFADSKVDTQPKLMYTDGMEGNEVEHAEAVISAVIQFMIILGVISFVRGIFIIRGVAEGNGQASMMAGVTHIVGGALAVNLGPVINAVTTTLGLREYGVQFN